MECLDSRKNKMLIDFNNREFSRNKTKVTTRFISGKLLMFAKLFLKSFIYDISEVFCFPDKTVAETYKKYLIEKVLVYHVMTDTEITELQFTFVFNPKRDLSEYKFRDIIFEVIIATTIYKRFDISHKFWDIFGFREESR